MRPTMITELGQEARIRRYRHRLRKLESLLRKKIRVYHLYLNRHVCVLVVPTVVFLHTPIPIPSYVGNPPHEIPGSERG